MIIVTIILCTATMFICFYYLGVQSKRLDKTIKHLENELKDANYLSNMAEIRAQNVETRLEKLVKNLYTTVLESKKQFLKTGNDGKRI